MQQIYLAKTTYVHAQIFFNAMEKKRQQIKKGGGGDTLSHYQEVIILCRFSPLVCSHLALQNILFKF